MSETKNSGFFLKHRKSSALAVSVAVHAVLIVVALTFVAVKVVQKDEVDFEAREVKRPQMKLRKLQVPVKMERRQAPKLRQNIIARPRAPTVDIRMPEIVGVKGGIGSGSGTGLGGLGFGFEMPDLFGGNQRGSGSEFVGHFYDLKQNRDGSLSEIGALAKSGNRSDPAFGKAREAYRKVIYDFIKGDWKGYGLEDYFMSPREKFATTFLIPEISANEAPRAFGVEDQVKPMLWVAWYKGQITAPERGKYRFVGLGDDILAVRVKKELVLDACWKGLTEWSSKDPDNRKYSTYDGQHLVVGDWFNLEMGRSVPVDILIGEEPGGRCYFQLYIQKDGTRYPTVTEAYLDPKTKQTQTIQRPVLPIFKTAPVPDETLEKMKINPDWATAEGPMFGEVSGDG